MMSRSLAALTAALCAAFGAAMLQACGGSVGSGGTGMADGFAQGTVSGFGSIIVDGQRYDDRTIAALREVAPGVEVPSDTRLGDAVEIDLDAGGVPTRLHVDAALVGPVASVGVAGRFVVLGQTVVVNADAAFGPVTQFGGGYDGAGSVSAGDAVEVHGVVARDGALAVIQATRVERLAAAPLTLKATGLASEVSGGMFRIGGLQVDATAAPVLPAGRVLVDGERVAVLAPAAGLTTDASGVASLRAAQVRIKRAGDAGAAVTLGGTIGGLDTAARRFDLGGRTVRYDGAALSGSALADGRYVRVRGSVLADGSVQAETVVVRDGTGEPETELKGNILGYDAASQRFEVRGVPVDASGAEVDECAGDVLAEGLYVKVEGRLGPTGVIAKSVHCEDEQEGDTVEREGLAGAVDAAASRFVLTTSRGDALSVQWSDSTYFAGIDVATLDGARIEVEGHFEGDVLIAHEVHLEH